MGASLDIVVTATVLEEELIIAPERRDLVRAGDEPANKFLFATELGRLIVGNNLEHNSVSRDNEQLVLEVIFVFIFPSVDIVRLNVDFIGPVRVLLFLTILIEISQVHNGSAAGVISDTREMLANGLAGALVIGLAKNGRPSVLKEVEGLLAIEGEHGYPVGRVNAVTKELDSVSRDGFGNVRERLNSIGDAHDDVLGTSENASVRRIRVSDVFHLSNGANGMGNLLSVNRHSITDNIVGEVHILSEKGLELWAREESLAGTISKRLLPNKFFLAKCAHCLILWGIKILGVLGEDAISVRVLATMQIGLIVTPVIESTLVRVRLEIGEALDTMRIEISCRRVAAAGLFDVTTLLLS